MKQERKGRSSFCKVIIPFVEKIIKVYETVILEQSIGISNGVTVVRKKWKDLKVQRPGCPNPYNL